MEMFHSVQGEGYWTGHNAFFIRLAGCDVGCPWCDTKESWTAKGHPILNIAAIVAEVRASGSPIAVITGGEPLMHNLDGLTHALQSAGIRTHLETSGAHPLSGQWEWITLSPKPHRPPLEEILESCDELKVIVSEVADFRWATEMKVKAHNAYHFYLQPEWSRREAAIPLILEHIASHPRWRIGLQTHKLLSIK